MSDATKLHRITKEIDEFSRAHGTDVEAASAAFQDYVKDIISTNALGTAAEERVVQRLNQLARQGGRLDGIEDVKTLIIEGWVEGFLVGYKFAERRYT